MVLFCPGIFIVASEINRINAAITTDLFYQKPKEIFQLFGDKNTLE